MNKCLNYFITGALAILLFLGGYYIRCGQEWYNFTQCQEELKKEKLRWIPEKIYLMVLNNGWKAINENSKFQEYDYVIIPLTEKGHIVYKYLGDPKTEIMVYVE